MSEDPSALRVPVLDRLLSHPRFVWFVVGLTLLLGLPSLGAGLVADDLLHRAFFLAQLSGHSDAQWWDMFVLYEHDPSRTIGLRTAGRYPWWVDPDLHVAFFRPLAAATHWLDYRLWPNTPWVMHLHSLVWHAAACVMAWLVARRVGSSPRVAGVVALVYAVSITHVVAWSWLAHRNGLVSTFWALAALLAHIRWRSEGDRVAAVLAPVSLAAALLSAEAAVVILAFISAYELLLTDDGRLRRLIALGPAIATIGAWRLGYGALGYGASHSGSYIGPLSSPLGFAEALPGRLSKLVALAVGPPYIPGLPSWALGVWVGLAGFIALVLLLFVFKTRNKTAGLGLMAAVLGCVPLAASVPLDRVLILPSFGVALAVAELVDAWLLQRAGPAASIGASVVSLVHLLAPIPAGLRVAANLDRAVAHRIDGHGEQLPDPGLSRRGLVIVHAPHLPAVDMLMLNRAARGLELPNFVWTLHVGKEQPHPTCVDAQSIRLEAPDLGWPSGAVAAVFRSTTTDPFHVGDQVRTLDYTAKVEGVEGGRATSVEFEFRAPIDHPSLAWASWDGHDFVPLDPRELCD